MAALQKLYSDESIDRSPTARATSRTIPIPTASEASRRTSISRTSFFRKLSNTATLEGGDLLGIPLSDLLASFASVFADQGAIAREDPVGVFSLSHPVHRLDYFVSHAWATPHQHKHLALILYFNVLPAFVVTIVVGLISFSGCLFYPEHIPSILLVTDLSPVDRSPVRQPVVSTLLCPITFVLALLFVHLLRTPVSLFLDIACIQQDDAAAKAQGISNLGAILDRSSRMLILLDEHYFERLWCAFEVASFSHRAGLHRVVVLPLHAALFDFSVILCFSVALFSINTAIKLGNVWLLSHHYDPYVWWFEHLQSVLYVVSSCGVVLIPLFGYFRGNPSRLATTALAEFNLERAQCYSEEDRKVILSLIGEWFVGGDDILRAPSDPASDNAMHRRSVGQRNFESFIRHEMPLLIERSEKDFKRNMWLVTSSPLFFGILTDHVASPEVGIFAAGCMVYIIFLTLALWWPLSMRNLRFCGQFFSKMMDGGNGRITCSFFGVLATLLSSTIKDLFWIFFVTPNVFVLPEWRVAEVDALLVDLDKQTILLIKWYMVAIFAAGLLCGGRIIASQS